MPDIWTDITHDEALLWLNDRLGKSVHVAVMREKGDASLTVLNAEGELHHWRESEGSGALAGYAREELLGWYAVGDARFDLTDLGHLQSRKRNDIDVLAVLLTEDGEVSLEIVEQQPLGEESNDAS